MVAIDLNSDLGESFGRYTVGNDEAVMGLITSANVACGVHAGDPDVMAQTVAVAAQRGVAIGAHPGFPDRQGFGRRYLAMAPLEVEHLVTYQVAALAGFTKGHRLHHVKPHGALYNAAAKDYDLALAICRGVKQFDPGLPLYGLAGSAPPVTWTSSPTRGARRTSSTPSPILWASAATTPAWSSTSGRAETWN